MFRGEVGEEVADVLVAANPTTGERDREAVHGATAIGVNQASDERLGVAGRQVALPVDQLDPPGVLLARAVLGEGERKGGVAQLQDRPSTAVRVATYSDIREEQRKSLNGLANHVLVVAVESQPSGGSPSLNDVAVTQMEPESIAVSRLCDGAPRRACQSEALLERRWGAAARLHEHMFA